jgi:DNA-binding MarR family transcriptional regulator
MAFVYVLTDDFLEEGDLASITTYQAGVMQSSVHRSLQKQSDQILKPYGITKMHWLIIGAVMDKGKAGIRITELAEALGTTLPYLTTTINLLQSKNILQRVHNSKDSRSKLITINTDFIPQCEKIERAMRQELQKTMYANIDPQDLRTYMKVLYQLSHVRV